MLFALSKEVIFGIVFGGVLILAVGEWMARRNRKRVDRRLLALAILGSYSVSIAVLAGIHDRIAKRRGGPINKVELLTFVTIFAGVCCAWCVYSWRRGYFYDYFGDRHYRSESPGTYWFYATVFMAISGSIIINGIFWAVVN